MNQPRPSDLTPMLLGGISIVFASLGRGLFCLDRQLRVRHAGPSIDMAIGEGAAATAIGMPIADLLGEELFGEGGSLRAALERNHRREGWGAELRIPGFPPRMVSVTAAPALHPPDAPYCDPDVFAFVVFRPIRDTNPIHRDGTTAFAGMIARSQAMQRLFSLVESLDHSDATVLLTGESGTGKELLARALHQHSPRRSGPFVAVNCGAIPGDLLESELFGHKKGAFTGAVEDRDGRFAAAQHGTLFLDEIGDLPLPLQVKLLRVLQEHSFERVGDNQTVTTNARIIAATHVNLPEAVREGSFREDLFYRLRVIPIEIPPLRKRRDDIEPLAEFLLDRLAARRGRSLRLAASVHRALLAHDWPGNVRELENTLAYAEAVANGDTIHLGDLPVELRKAVGAAASEEILEGGLPSDEELPDETGRILAALQHHRWKRAPAAAELGMSRSTLWRKMRELGLDEGH